MHNKNLCIYVAFSLLYSAKLMIINLPKTSFYLINHGTWRILNNLLLTQKAIRTKNRRKVDSSESVYFVLYFLIAKKKKPTTKRNINKLLSRVRHEQCVLMKAKVIWMSENSKCLLLFDKFLTALKTFMDKTSNKKRYNNWSKNWFKNWYKILCTKSVKLFPNFFQRS